MSSEQKKNFIRSFQFVSIHLCVLFPFCLCSNVVGYGKNPLRKQPGVRIIFMHSNQISCEKHQPVFIFLFHFEQEDDNVKHDDRTTEPTKKERKKYALRKDFP